MDIRASITPNLKHLLIPAYVYNWALIMCMQSILHYSNSSTYKYNDHIIVVHH